MHAKNALTLQTQLTLPLIPFVIDTFARAIILRHQLHWYQIPDLVTLLVTFAFFCLGVMYSITPREISSDPELNANIELVRQKLLGNCIFAVTLAGGLSFFRASSDLLPSNPMYEESGFYVFVSVVLFVAYTLIQVLRRYMSYISGTA